MSSGALRRVARDAVRTVLSSVAGFLDGAYEAIAEPRGMRETREIRRELAGGVYRLGHASRVGRAFTLDKPPVHGRFGCDGRYRMPPECEPDAVVVPVGPGIMEHIPETTLERADNAERDTRREVGRALQDEIAGYIATERPETPTGAARISAFAAIGYAVENETGVAYVNPLEDHPINDPDRRESE